MKKKFNFVDICVLVLVIVFIIGLGVRYVSIDKPSVVDKKLAYVVKVSQVRSFSADALRQSKDISDGVDNVYGDITDVKVVPAETEYTTTEGEIVTVSIPEKYDCFVTIESDVLKKDNIYYLDDETSVSVGEEIEIITKYVKTLGTIVEVNEIG